MNEKKKVEGTGECEELKKEKENDELELDYSIVLNIEALEIINSIISKYPYNTSLLVAQDIFVSGYIYGSKGSSNPR